MYNRRNERFSITQAPPSASIAFGQPGSSALSASPSSEHPGAGKKVREKRRINMVTILIAKNKISKDTERVLILMISFFKIVEV